MASERLTRRPLQDEPLPRADFGRIVTDHCGTAPVGNDSDKSASEILLRQREARGLCLTQLATAGAVRVAIGRLRAGGKAKHISALKPGSRTTRRTVSWRFLELHSAARHFPRRLLSAALALSFGIVLLVALPATKAAAAPCDAPVVNEIACENTKTGNPSSEWQISGSGSSSIQGFATDISVNRGSTIGFKVKTTSTNYRLDIYRMGYYGGDGRPEGRDGQSHGAFPTSPPARTKAAPD